MTRRIKADYVPVLHLGDGRILKAGDVVPDGVTVGDHAAEDDEEKPPERKAARKPAEHS